MEAFKRIYKPIQGDRFLETCFGNGMINVDRQYAVLDVWYDSLHEVELKSQGFNVFRILDTHSELETNVIITELAKLSAPKIEIPKSNTHQASVWDVEYCVRYLKKLTPEQKVIFKLHGKGLSTRDIVQWFKKNKNTDYSQSSINRTIVWIKEQVRLRRQLKSKYDDDDDSVI